MPLAERLQQWRERPRPLRTTLDRGLAEQRLRNWRAQTPLTVPAHFEQWLLAGGMTEEEFFQVLGQPDGAQPVPAWTAVLREAFACHPRESVVAQLGLEREEAGFLRTIEPLVSHGQRRLREGLRHLEAEQARLPFDPETAEKLLLALLPGWLLPMLRRPLVLELHIARLQGVLVGDSPEERFDRFLEKLGEGRRMLLLLQEYPVLARQLVERIETWVAVGLEFLGRLGDDWQTICAHFSPDTNPGDLIELEGGMGDRHRGGRSVLIAGFTTGLRVVYKPRSLAVDTHFQELLGWLNARGARPHFRQLAVLDRGSHGWAEYIDAQSCTDEAQVRRFYERQGGYLALLFTLEATDFHFENLIAAGEHPCLIDLEALFHGRLRPHEDDSATAQAEQALANSVLRVGLLPQRWWVYGSGKGIEVSGLGALPGQMTPRRVFCWEAAGTDRMRLVRRRVERSAGNNRPHLNDAPVDLLDYSAAIVAGFDHTYRLLMHHRDGLLAEDGPLERFAGDEVRALLRPTGVYHLLLEESFHPTLLSDALERDRFLDRLWVGIESSPWLSWLIPAEKEDLQRADVPFFVTRPNTCHLWRSTGQRLTGVFAEAGLSAARRRIRQLSEAGLEQQTWFIYASLATLPIEASRQLQHVRPLKSALRQPVEPPQLRAAARSVGERLAALALGGRQDATWLGLVLDGQSGHWSLAPLGVDLYAGLAGVALFLAYLGDRLGEPRYSELAQGALLTLQRRLAQRPGVLRSIGGFWGWGSVLYLLSHLAALWNREDLLEAGLAIVADLPPLIEEDETFDVVGGAAGCIGGLLSLYHCAPSPSVLAAARLCGERLCRQAQAMENGLVWLGRPLGRPLLGFSHGGAGIAWALLKLAQVTGEERFRTVALGAMAFERSHFSTEVDNWPDLRAGNTNRTYMTSWCHGAPGIGLARLDTLLCLQDPLMRLEIALAVKTTLRDGFGGSHCLCHGDLGNLELLSMAGSLFDDLALEPRVEQMKAAILENIDAGGWRCGLPLEVESPGLMNGLAGIGYGLLRLAEPASVPSVLLLSPPRRAPA